MYNDRLSSVQAKSSKLFFTGRVTSFRLFHPGRVLPISHILSSDISIININAITKYCSYILLDACSWFKDVDLSKKLLFHFFKQLHDQYDIGEAQAKTYNLRPEEKWYCGQDIINLQLFASDKETQEDPARIQSVVSHSNLQNKTLKYITTFISNTRRAEVNPPVMHQSHAGSFYNFGSSQLLTRGAFFPKWSYNYCFDQERPLQYL